MSVYSLKPRFQSLLRPLSDGLASAGVSANMVTIAALVLSILEGIALANDPGASVPLLALPVVLLVRMALNAIDGMIAREHAQQSDTGAYLNEIGDIVSDLALYTPLVLAIYTPLSVSIVVLYVVYLIGIPVSETVGIMAERIGGIRRYDGPMGKSDRALCMGVFAVLLAPLNLDDVGSVTTVFVIVLVLAIGVWRTAYKRYARSLVDKQKKG
jgi:CDP-diacylglycerol--glycerol-3-phosphate 3-phosphatidyltransferase